MSERLRDLGLRIGELEAGPTNSIVDVTGVAVGHVTIRRDEPEPPYGRGIARTGVTAVLPGPADDLHGAPMPAGAAVLNGAGELTGFLQVREWGVLETPVYLTSTMAVGRVFDGVVAEAVRADARVGVEDVVIPVVGECDDSYLSDARTVQVEAADAGRAVAAASRERPAEGAVGAGTGMVCFGWKGGIGSSSRLVPELGCVLGALVLANFGAPRELRVDGVPVGRMLSAPESPPAPGGSCIVVLASDASLAPVQLERLARRAGLGLARTGSVAHDASGEIFLAFATTGRHPRPGHAVSNRSLDPLFAAAVDATEEAVLNALWACEDERGREGRVVRALPHDAVLELLARHGRT